MAGGDRQEIEQRLRRAKDVAKEFKAMTPDEFIQGMLRTECDEFKAKVRLAGLVPVEGEDPLLSTRLLHAMLGMCDETGEFAKVLKRWLYYGQPLDRDGLREELGDLLWYVALGLDALGLSFEAVMVANRDKLRARYPEMFTEGQALHANRDTDREREALTRSVSVEDVLGGDDPLPAEGV